MSTFPQLSNNEQADICLLLEGTYPYVRGGVSSWVHQLISGLPEFSFALVFIGANREYYPKLWYDFPENVCHFEAHFLDEKSVGSPPHEFKGDESYFQYSDELHEYFQTDGESACPVNIGNKGTISVTQQADNFYYSERSWEKITDSYKTNCAEMPFLEYFWNVRAMHAPVFKLMEIANHLPSARLYHSASTGYAGLLGHYAHALYSLPLLITEHGIYIKERQIDLYLAEWIKEQESPLPQGINSEINYLRQLWSRFFEGLGRMTYQSATKIVSLYQNNCDKQIEYGAPAEKTMVIPNGVRLEQLEQLRALRPAQPPPVLGLIGRVVPIKDIKNFIRAIDYASRNFPEIEGWIIGSEDEEPRYAKECHELVKSLGQQNRIRFLGFQKIDDILPRLGLLALTSISEAQPLVILEAYAAGLPVLTTDVGSCRELIEGYSAEDRQLGRAGGIAPIGDPAAFAEAAIHLLTRKDVWLKAQQAAISRVERFYDEKAFLHNYRTLYKTMT
uniref:Extracellular matrix protein PelF, glycosyltransferase, group 1 n=1 Tax=uncultured Thiotrichaceae bacterium TaxID=298394 RepID=A0A6S6UF02_9GAMM|nr:MAG: Extracellular matrix protein PelF, glycosyltransferase, group 1 [uncultured Thiotrichaceae bacterium]